MAISPTSSGTSNFNFDGVVSGLNTTDIIDKLMSLESAPLTHLAQQKQSIQRRDKAYQDLRTRVSAFQSSLQTLMLTSSVLAKSTTSSTTSVATAVANSDAVNSTFSLNVTRLATATSVASTGAISKGLDPNAPITSAGFANTPTVGTFTVNGVQISLASGDTMSSLLNKITDSSAGGSGAGTGVVASLVNDSNGNPSFVRLTPIAGNNNPIQLGSGADTSNFLSAAALTATNVAGGSVQSSIPLGATQPGQALSISGARFNLPAGTTLASSGSFQINGVAINWTNSDSLSTVLNRINASGAGVRASYDAVADKVSLTNVATGNQAVSLSETAPPAGQAGILQALGLSSANAQYGQTAQYAITQNGVTGPTQYSNSNTVTNALPGVTLSLAGTGTTTISVSQDTNTAVKNVQAFVDQFNQLADLVDQGTAYNAATKTGGILMGDPAVSGLMSQIRTLISSAAPGLSGQYTTMSSIGISTGAVGSAVGTTNHLTINQDKLTNAIQNNPSAVLAVLTGNPQATLNPDGNGNARAGSWIASIGGVPAGSVYGSYKVTVDTSGNMTSVFTPSGKSSLPSVTSTIVAGGTNTTLIPGLTVTAQGSLPASPRTDTIWFGQPGVLGRLNDMVNGVLGPNGSFNAEQSSASNEMRYIDDQVRSSSDRLDQRRQALQKQFTAMEVAMGQLQQQGQQLLSKLG